MHEVLKVFSKIKISFDLVAKTISKLVNIPVTPSIQWGLWSLDSKAVFHRPDVYKSTYETMF